ncbi:sensor histidine kinase [Clostridium sp. SHJSY1]|uniref:sensor histidine kinase n=1 Tax=Clostridium sp. SHJSY1 TaxID=2942483 RepID=UPI00287425FC|nr:sensor histidine kinase [Clostridium sp. SHJSY1]MDS0526146.1 sensor histidine kinase [Clostridium sp. SHJSY1]
MNIADYIKSRVGNMLLNFIELMTLSIFLFSTGNTFDTIITIVAIWIVIFMIIFIYDYKKRKLYYDDLLMIAEKLDKKYLISEVIEYPPFLDAKPYYILMKKSRKSMLEEINKIKRQRKEYKEYIEQWIHEVKTPISAIKLIGENNKTNVSRGILEELENIDRYVEQALFFARSEEVEKDYLIKEISLETSITQAIIRNKHMFILNNIDVELNDIDKNVFSDSKWLEFIINQIVINSIKYRKEDSPKINICTKYVKNGIQLIVEDNGIGINDNEINRIFEKGFTGENGRINGKSTGIGLYLCKKLCEKLGLLITVDSKINVYTKIIITFPKGEFCKYP